MTDNVLRVTPHLVLPLDDLEWRFSASGGPGGQHANTSNTRAEVRFDVTTSTALSEPQRERILAKLGPVVRSQASDERSQGRNRDLALERLAAALAGALRIERPRRATKPSAAARRRRLTEKSRRADRKADRRPPRGDD
jgi:ribosome-associated protein